MKTIRISAFFCILLALIMALTACASTSKPAETENASTMSAAPSKTDGTTPSEGNEEIPTITWGLTVTSMTEFYSTQFAAYDKWTNESTDFKFNCLGRFDSKRDSAKQFEHIDGYVTQGADVLVVIPYDTSIGAEYLDHADGTPVIFTNRKPIDESLLESDTVCYVGGSEYSAGQLQGEYMAKLCKDKGLTEINYVLLMGDLNSPNAVERAQGAEDTLNACGIPVNQIYKDGCNWSRAEGLTKTEQLIGAGENIDIIVCGSDDIALGAYEAVKAAGLQDKIKIAGLDGSVAGYTSVMNGELAMTVLQNGPAQAKQAVECMKMIMRGEPLDAYYEVPFESITPDNVDDYAWLLD